MNIKKKISAIILSLCMVLTFVPMVAFAAEGRISFTDPTTPAGEEFTVRVVVRSDSGSSLGTIKVQLAYDPALIEFKDGENTTLESSGELVFEADVDGESSEVEAELTFLALKQGENKITVQSHEATLDSGETLNCREGSSTITVEGGTEIEASETSSGSSTSVTVDETEYMLTSNFSDAAIPDQYERSEIDFAGTTYSVVSNPNNGLTLGYLVDSSQEGEFFVYQAEDATFFPYQQISVSDDSYIVLLRNTSGLSIPEQYQETTLTVNGHDFPTWQDTVNSGYYLMYAVNNQGTKELYQYDTQEQTYQRFITPLAVEEEVTLEGWMGALLGFVENNLILVIASIVALLVFLLILLLVLGIKLVRRNREIDDLYDEYGIDEEDDFDNMSSKGKKTVEEDYGFDDYDDYDEFEEEKIDSEFDNFETSFGFEEENEFEDLTSSYEDAYEEFEDVKPLSRKRNESKTKSVSIQPQRQQSRKIGNEGQSTQVQMQNRRSPAPNQRSNVSQGIKSRNRRANDDIDFIDL